MAYRLNNVFFNDATKEEADKMIAVVKDYGIAIDSINYHLDQNPSVRAVCVSPRLMALIQVSELPVAPDMDLYVDSALGVSDLSYYFTEPEVNNHGEKESKSLSDND
jgi:hypothetical protein